MSLPMVLGMLVNALYNIVDSYFVAQISENAMTSISLVYPLQLIVTAVAVGHGIGESNASAGWNAFRRTETGADALDGDDGYAGAFASGRAYRGARSRNGGKGA